MDITLDAYAMHQEGLPVPQIKARIDAKYARYWPYEKTWP